MWWNPSVTTNNLAIAWIYPLKQNGCIVQIEELRYPLSILSGLLISFAIWQTLRERWKSTELHTVSDIGDRERRHLERQIRRRIQIGFLVGLSGFGIFLGTFMPSTGSWFSWFLLTWFLTFLFLFWTMLLGVIDAVSIQMYFGSLNRDVASEAAKLRYEMMKKIKEEKERESSNQEDKKP